VTLNNLLMFLASYDMNDLPLDEICLSIQREL